MSEEIDKQEPGRLWRSAFAVVLSLLLAIFVYQVLVRAAVAQTTAKDGLYDFRAKQLYSEKIEAAHPEPFVDERILAKRLGWLSTSLSPGTRDGARLTRRLSLHVVVRYDSHEHQPQFLDVHIPAPLDPIQPAIGELNQVYQEEIERRVLEFVSASGVALEPDGQYADILIHVNLTERRQAAAGFLFENLKPLPQRLAFATKLNDLKGTEFALPWTVVKIYTRDRPIEFPEGSSVEGGEIWIQFPKRTFWQAEIAQAALDSAVVRDRFGLGQTRDEIISRFRNPQELDLDGLVDAISTVNHHSHGRRPRENLLSLATGWLQPMPTVGGSTFCASCAAKCGQISHSSRVAARLIRALAMFVGGIRAGAVVTWPQGDYSSLALQDRNSLMADLSLLGYRAEYDQRLNDQLAWLILRYRQKNPTVGQYFGLPVKIPEDQKILPGNKFKELENRIFESQRADIVSAMNDVGRSFATPNSCMNEINLFSRHLGKDEEGER